MMKINFPLNRIVLLILLLSNCSGDQEEWKKADRLTPLKEYTEDESREWEDYKEEHIPVIRKSIERGEPAILIELPKLTTSYGHYIESMGILDEEGILLASKSIERSMNPLNYAYIPMESLSETNLLKAFIKCNLHDTWVKEFRISDLKQ